ncbi:MAG: hypothetical protein QCI00_09165, partial [Candidatus Thermoplasmatota archaeon]|nr:hypothetical protein [Candidatus Thermoplasmatota archaeon]
WFTFNKFLNEDIDSCEKSKGAHKKTSRKNYHLKKMVEKIIFSIVYLFISIKNKFGCNRMLELFWREGGESF